MTIHLTASEKSYLWTNYMIDSMAVCILKYYIEKCEDEEIKEVLLYALDLSKLHVDTAANILSDENFPLPKGFTDEDVNLSAPRLFSDEFVLFYLHQFANLGLSYYAKAISMVAREDVHEFYKECISSSTELNARTKELLLKKGLYVRPPYIPDPPESETIEKIGYLKGYLGEKRPLMGLEISNLFFNIQTLEVVKVLLKGFAQVAKSKDVRDYLTRGKKICMKSIKVLRERLERDELASSTPWYTFVSDSTTPPFSDPLIMFQGAVLYGAGIEQFGYSIATMMRRDIGVLYAQLLTEMMTYSDDGMNLLIKNHWMEQPPMAMKRNEQK